MNREEGIKKIIKECRNIGKKTAPCLYDIGVRGVKDLQKLGAKKAFLEIWKKNPTQVCIHPCYLWAFEGAICGKHLLDISPEKKEELRKYTQDLKNAF